MKAGIWKMFFSQKSLQGRIFVVFGLTISLLLIVTGSFFTYTSYRQSIENAAKQNEQLSLVNATGAKMRIYRAIGAVRTMSISVDEMFKSGDLNTDSLVTQITSALCHKINTYNDIMLYTAAYYSFNRKFLPADGVNGRKLYISTSGRSGVSVYDKGELSGTDEVESCMLRTESIKQTTISAPHMSRYPNGEPASFVLSVTAPIIYKDNVVGSAGLDIPLEQFQRIISKLNIPKGTSAYLVSHDGIVVAHTNQAMIGKSTYSLDKPELTRIFRTIFENKGTSDNAYLGESNRESYFVVPVNMDQSYTTWAQGITMPNSVIYHKSHVSLLIAIGILCLGIGISLMISFWLAGRITKPINILNNSIKKLARGEIKSSTQIEITSLDEIGQIGTSVNHLIKSLDNATEFAAAIGNENFQKEYALSGTSDDLGHSLLDMKDSLLKAKQNEEKRKDEERLNAWSNEGFTKFSELLRGNHDDMGKLSSLLISKIVKYIGCEQGGIYILEEDGEYFDQTACFAYNRQKINHTRVHKSEGLIGRCYFESEAIYLLNVPSDYLTITSGLGDALPTSLLLVPMKSNGSVNGIIELASIKPIDEYKIRFVEKVAESISSTISSVRIGIKTAGLLETTRLQAQEMAAAEEEMRQNLEELQSTQEEMNRIQYEQKSVIEKLGIDSSIFLSLLQNTQEGILVLDKNQNIIRISNNLANAFGYDSAAELYDKCYSSLLNEESVGKELEKNRNILETYNPLLNSEETIAAKSGMLICASIDRYPVVDFQYIILIYKNITAHI